MTQTDFAFVRRFVHERSALTLDEGKDYLVSARLEPIVRREGLSSLAELARALRAGDARLSEEVVDALVTNETSFFRDAHPFDALRDRVLREHRDRPLAIWSAAASTGQEPYSIAMLLREYQGDGSAVSILATDLSGRALARGRSGRFTQQEINRGLPAPLLVKYFHRDGRDWVIDDLSRRMVTFRQMNLARDLHAVPLMDVVFLRNVLIYFDAETKAAVLGRVARAMRPGGYLFLGASETTYGIDRSFERIQTGKAVYYRLTPSAR